MLQPALLYRALVVTLVNKSFWKRYYFNNKSCHRIWLFPKFHSLHTCTNYCINTHLNFIPPFHSRICHVTALQEATPQNSICIPCSHHPRHIFILSIVLWFHNRKNTKMSWFVGQVPPCNKHSTVRLHAFHLLYSQIFLMRNMYSDIYSRRTRQR